MKVIHKNDYSKLDLEKKIYRCSHCEKLFNWNTESRWFGSLKAQEDGEELIYSCSEKCRKELDK